jgi:RNA polymerase sigma factor (sigma-70 family)
MMTVLAEPDFTDSELVIGQTPKTTRPEVLEENRLIEQVWARTALLKAKCSNFTPSEYRIKLQGEHALETLLKRHNKRICALVLEHQTKEGSADADLKQEAIAAFIQAIDTFDPANGARLSTYAYLPIKASLQAATGKENRNGIAKAKVLNEEAGFQIEPISDSYRHAQVNAAIEQLSEREREIIALRQKDIPFAEIAEYFQRSVKRVCNIYYETLRKLRSILGAVFSCKPDPQLEINESIEAENIEPEDQTLDRAETVEPAQKLGSKIFRVLFGFKPITNAVNPKNPPSWIEGLEQSFDTVRRQVDRFTERIHLFPKGEFMRQPKTTQPVSQPDSGTPYLLPSARKKRPNLLQRINAKLPPLWLNIPLTGIVLYFAHNAILDSFAIAMGLTIAYLFGIGKLSRYVRIKPKDRAWYTGVGTVIISLLSAPQAMYAQTATGAACPSAGFLNTLASFASNVLTSNSGTSVSTLNSFICQFIGILALIAIVMMVGGLIYAGFEITVNRQGLSTVAQPVIGMMVTVMLCIGAINIMATSTGNVAATGG